MATVKELNAIAALDWTRDEDNAGGYVAPVNTGELPQLKQKFSNAGYEVSDSKDDAGQRFLWVMGGR